MPGRPAAARSTSPAPTIPTPTSPIGARAIRCPVTTRPTVPATISTPTALLAIDAATGKIKWHFQYTPNDNRDYDETGTHILIDTKVNGEDRKIVSHAGRNGFNYVFDRLNGQFLKATQHVGKVTWTKGIDPKTGKPLDYDPARDVQIYGEGANVNDDKVTRSVCPDNAGRHQLLAGLLQPQDRLVYIPELEGCADITPDHSRACEGQVRRRQLRQPRTHHQRHRRCSIRRPAR